LSINVTFRYSTAHAIRMSATKPQTHDHIRLASIGTKGMSFKP